MAIATVEPKKIVKGTTEEWEKTFADYPSDEWDLTYYFRGAGAGLDVTATAGGESSETDFTVTISATDSATLTVGNYRWQAVVEKDSEKFLVGEGVITVKAGLAALAAEDVFETRSGIKIILDKIDAMISGSLDKNVYEYTINNRQLRHYPLTELIQLREKYARLYAQEVTNSNDNPSPFMKGRLYRHNKAS